MKISTKAPFLGLASLFLLSTSGCAAPAADLAGVRPAAGAAPDAPTVQSAGNGSILPVPDGEFVMFDDGERSGWFSHQNSFTLAASPVHSGTKSLSFAEPNKGYQFTMGWEGSFWSAPFDRLEFWVHGGQTGGQTLVLTGMLRDALKGTWGDASTVTLPDPKYGAIEAGKWTKISIPLADLGVANRLDFRGINVQTKDKVGLFIDDMMLAGTVPTSATVSVDANAVVRRLNNHIYGMDTYGVAQVKNPIEVAAAKDAGYGLHRAFYPTFDMFKGAAQGLPFAEATGADAIGCVLYTDIADYLDGKKYGTAQEAAALVAYANVPTDAPAKLLDFNIGKDVKGHDWGTVRRWVNIRATDEKLAQDDKFNVMRIKHPKPFGVKLWELDNEPWLRGSDTDWKAYADWCKEADKLMRQVDPTIQTGVSLIGGDENPGLVKHEIINPVTKQKHTGFNHVVLYYLSGQDPANSPGKYRPDFIICHNYSGTNDGPGANLATLWTYQQRNGTDWVSTAQMYRNFLSDYYGEDGLKTHFIVTENNIAATFPLSKQTVSLVGGLYAADDLASIMLSKEGDFEGLTWHDWEDGPLEKGGYLENPYLYGWRNEAGYGVYRDGARTKYPIHYAFRLLSKYFGKGGDAVLTASSNTPYLAAYAVKQQNGNLAVLLINKARDTSINATVSFKGYTPLSAATLYHYGKTEDRAESDISVSALADGRKAIACPGYSMSVVTFTQNGVKAVTPTEIRALAGNAKADLVWTAMSGATSYDLFRAAGNETPKLLKSDVRATTFSDTGLVNGTAYFYSVASHGSADKTEKVEVTPQNAPGAVTGLEAVAADNQVRLSWKPVEGATDYVVRRASSASGPFETLTTHPYERQFNQSISFTVHRDRELKEGATYFYQVAATNAGGQGKAASVSAVPSAVPAPWKAIDLSGRPNGSTRFDAKTGRFTLEGEGASWYGAGEGRFVYQKISGDGTLTARIVAGEDGLYDKNTFGVMLRDSLALGKETRWALIAMTPEYPGNGNTNGASFMSSGPGSANKMSFQADSVGDNAKRFKMPYWVRLTRRGDQITGFVSPDGSEGSWQEFGSDTLKGLPNDVYLGLVANSMVFFAPRAGEFDNVTLSK